MSETLENTEFSPSFKNFVPTGLSDAKRMEQRLGLATLGYQQALTSLMDALDEQMFGEADISVLNLVAQADLWDAYHNAALEYMRVTISLANAKRRAKNKE